MNNRTLTCTSALIAGLLLVIATGCSSSPRGDGDTGSGPDVESDTTADTAVPEDTSADDTGTSDTEADTEPSDADTQGGSDTGEDASGDTDPTDTSADDTAGDTSGTVDTTDGGDTNPDASGCGPNAGSCGTDEYCDFPDDRCGEGQTGSCKVQPQACPEIQDPVCGCDDTTYGNECKAAANGVDIRHKGRCATTGCTSTDDCASDEYCDFPDDNCGEGQNGSCKPRPGICPAVINPVCGCDDTTHNNRCEAAADGVDVQYEGKCN